MIRRSPVASLSPCSNSARTHAADLTVKPHPRSWRRLLRRAIPITDPMPSLSQTSAAARTRPTLAGTTDAVSALRLGVRPPGWPRSRGRGDLRQQQNCFDSPRPVTRSPNLGGTTRGSASTADPRRPLARHPGLLRFCWPDSAPATGDQTWWSSPPPSFRIDKSSICEWCAFRSRSMDVT
jgi:hypothetical protein